MVQQWILVFSVLGSVAVSSKVLRLAGSSVQLDIHKHGDHLAEVKWMFNTSIAVVRYHKRFKIAVAYLPFGKRAEINEDTQSLTLKNLRKSDSGLYEAKSTTHGNVSTVAVYSLSVLDPVAKPVIAAVPDPQTSNTTNVTFSCSGHNISVSSTCYNCKCEQKNKTGEENLELILSDNGRSIICQIHNPLSLEKSEIDMTQFNQLCPEGKDQAVFRPRWLMGVIAAGVVIIVVILIVIKPWKTETRCFE